MTFEVDLCEPCADMLDAYVSLVSALGEPSLPDAVFSDLCSGCNEAVRANLLF